VKQCPTCKRSFDDPLTFCPDDGTSLSDVQPASFGGKATWSASQDQIPELQKYIAAATNPTKQRKATPWLIAALAILILLALVVVIVVRR